MDLRDYLRILRHNWKLITAVTLAGLLTGALNSVLVKPTYTAETQLFVAIEGTGSVQELQQGNSFTQARIKSYVKTVTAPVVLRPAMESLGLAMTPMELSSKVRATADPNTVLITIAVDDNSPVQAAAIAQAVGTSLVQTIDSLEKPKAGGNSPVSLSIITPAEAPLTPSAPNTKLNLIIGFFVGLALALGIALLRATLDNRIRGEADLRRVTHAPILGGIAFDQDAVQRPLITQDHGQSPRSEAFRQLRTNLQFVNVSDHAKSVLLTSSLPGEGKSTVSINLALSLAQAGQSVCLIDADLRRPMVGDYLGLDRNAGLTTALLGTSDLTDLLQPWGEDSLFVLTSGQIPPNPSELLGSAEMKDLILRLEETFDVVIIDAPPLLPVTDAAVLSQHVGGVLVVVGSHKLQQKDLEKSLRSLELVGATILGIVMNQLPTNGPDAYAYSYYSSDSGAIKTALGTGNKRREFRAPRRHSRINQKHLPPVVAQPTDSSSEFREAAAFPRDRLAPSLEDHSR